MTGEMLHLESSYMTLSVHYVVKHFRKVPLKKTHVSDLPHHPSAVKFNYFVL